MKRKLIALLMPVFAAIPFSSYAALGSVEANGNGGSVEIGGTIYATETPVWLVATGTGYSNFVSSLSEMSEDQKTLSLTPAEAMPLLAVKTKYAYTLSSLATGTMPAVDITDNTGNSLYQYDTDTSNYSFSFNAPIVVDGNTAGTATFIGAEAGAVIMASFYGANINGTEGGVYNIAGNYTAAALYSPLMAPMAYVGTPESNLNVFSDLGQDKLVYDMQDFMPDVATWYNIETFQTLTGAALLSYFKGAEEAKAASALVFGLPQSGSIKLAFDSAIESTTTWRVPLNAVITYF